MGTGGEVAHVMIQGVDLHLSLQRKLSKRLMAPAKAREFVEDHTSKWDVFLEAEDNKTPLLGPTHEHVFPE